MRDYSEYKHIQVKREGRVLRLTLNSGDRNAFSEAMHTECSRIFSEIRADDEASVVVLTGAGKYFSIAAEMGWYGNITAGDWLRLMREARQIVHDMLALPQPIVIRMNGDAMGLGASLVGLGDFIVAAKGARLGDHHVQMGLVCGDGGAMTFPFSMGLQRAKEFYLLGREFTVEELHDMGVVTSVAAREELDAATDAVVNKLLEAPKEALLWTKATLNRMAQFSDFIGTDYSLAYEGWSWHLDPSQKFLAEQRATRGKGGPY